MQEAKVGLTIPILHDSFHAVTHDFFGQVVNGTLYVLEIEKRNNKIGDKEKLSGTRYADPWFKRKI
jgi:hypothetical protein